MAQPYVGEIRIFAGNFAPNGWFFCEGQLLPISEYETLFQLIGTTYGGDGESTFALPDLRGRLPVHMGTYQGITYTIGESAGTEDVTLNTNQIPSHTHDFRVTSDIGNVLSPTSAIIGVSTKAKIFFADPPGANFNAADILPVGGSQPHSNFQPYLCLNFIISLFGIFPSPT
ncbi:MAG: phage tail protein [Dyadobacter sp. 50-39]|uniref:phage tail protein n=1 Tax=Dyadobacter sp. 50-39 TaxID=1895756 RepID=UPI00096104D6|nr:tail fiber protein [Dyadobacter sp. 50-39]OJV14652.1 MAG: phage tail protein [Dyadobacter sp. 50-39]